MKFKLFVINLLFLSFVSGRKHHLEIRDDTRQYIALSTFGFYRNGLLTVDIHNFQIGLEDVDKTFGFTLDRTFTDSMNPYLNSHQDTCLLSENAAQQTSGQIAFLTFNFKKNILQLNCSQDWNTDIYKDVAEMEEFRSKRNPYSNTIFVQRRRRRDLAPSEDREVQYKLQRNCSNVHIPLIPHEKNIDKIITYSAKFVMLVGEGGEGLYNLYFHSCPNYNEHKKFQLHFDIDLEEKNEKNFLSADEMPLPALYFMMSVLFLLSGLFWVYILRKSKHQVYKIHYLMAVLVFLKSLSLLFHAINYHYIQVKGEHVEAWAILYYITHLMKGSVLFITIVLIGTGWTFIKHILADRDKKLFMIVIPLQVLANVAKIIFEESEEGDIEHKTWSDIFVLVDLLCCGAILFPVVWSIRHLQEASATDGKAATNLRKLKLFRQFYIMIVCYIYFTRIIVYLLQITVAFQYGWLDEMFKEMATYVFYVLTGYKFRPTTSHPYFHVDSDDEDDDEVEILTETGWTEGVTKVTNRSAPSSTILDSKEDERENLLSKRESSHEYD